MDILKNVFTLTLLLAGFEIIAMTLLQKEQLQSNKSYLIIAMAIYGLIIPIIILKTLNYNGIGTVNLMWNILTTVSMVIIGYYYFNEKINHLHVLSLMFGIASIILLYVASDFK